jgi:uncharacterized protein
LTHVAARSRSPQHGDVEHAGEPSQVVVVHEIVGVPSKTQLRPTLASFRHSPGEHESRKVPIRRALDRMLLLAVGNGRAPHSHVGRQVGEIDAEGAASDLAVKQACQEQRCLEDWVDEAVFLHRHEDVPHGSSSRLVSRALSEDLAIRRHTQGDLGGQVVLARYARHGSTLVIPHVEAPPALRGTGAASQLMAGVMEIARAKGLKVRPLCSYASV